MKWAWVALVVVALWPAVAHAQGDYGVRVPSRDGRWLLPVASRLLGSTDDDHVGRGSINSWDLSVSPGTPVYAAAPGVVEAAGCYLFERRQWPIMQGYGCALSVKHGDGIVSQYAHCKDVGFYVKVGDRVTADSLLCQSGQTGSASWPHVHFTILRNGGAVRIDSIFDVRLMRYCHFTKCVANNRPNDPIRGSIALSSADAGQPSATVATVSSTRYVQLLRILAQYPPQAVSLAIMAILGLLVLVYWLGGKTERIAIVGGVSGMAGATLIVWLMVPLGTPVQAGQGTAISGGDSWDKVYPIVQSMEGWKCTRDGAYTMGGVTQGTYNRWRAKKSMGSADVCANLTGAQAKAIYYELFWLPIGADKMPAALALTAVDHYINTGKVSHILAQCGQDVACFNQARIADYRTKGNCSLYCVAWINRVNKIRKYTGG